MIPGVFALFAAVLLAAGCSQPPAAGANRDGSSRTFKVATWNIRSGMGVRGFATRNWDDETLNCSDPSRPVNAWGVGFRYLIARRLGMYMGADIAKGPEDTAFYIQAGSAWR